MNIKSWRKKSLQLWCWCCAPKYRLLLLPTSDSRGRYEINNIKHMAERLLFNNNLQMQYWGGRFCEIMVTKKGHSKVPQTVIIRCRDFWIIKIKIKSLPEMTKRIVCFLMRWNYKNCLNMRRRVVEVSIAPPSCFSPWLEKEKLFHLASMSVYQHGASTVPACIIYLRGLTNKGRRVINTQTAAWTQREDLDVADRNVHIAWTWKGRFHSQPVDKCRLAS